MTEVKARSGPGMNMYTAAIMATRSEVLRIKSAIVIAASDAEAEREGIAAAMVAFPETDGFSDWQIVIAEVPSPAVFGEYQLIWQVV